MSVSLDGIYGKLMPHDFTDLAFYFTVVNNDDVPHTMLSVSGVDPTKGVFMTYYGPLGNKVLQPLVHPVVAARGTYTFAPGGDHVRILGYKIQPQPGSTTMITIGFENGCYKTVDNVPVQDRMNPI
jgi:copper(I)-binding protein